jgi:hypothetical protein
MHLESVWAALPYFHPRPRGAHKRKRPDLGMYWHNTVLLVTNSRRDQDRKFHFFALFCAGRLRCLVAVVLVTAASLKTSIIFLMPQEENTVHYNCRTIGHQFTFAGAVDRDSQFFHNRKLSSAQTIARGFTSPRQFPNFVVPRNRTALPDVERT